MRSLALLLALAAWQSDAQAFFCFSFGGHARYRDHPPLAPWQAPPPMSFPTATWALPETPGSEPLPPIRETKKSPELIQGYRFRPLDENHQTAQPSPPADWRD